MNNNNNINEYEADLAGIKHYYKYTKAFYEDYLRELAETPACNNLEEQENMDDMDLAYQKCRKNCEFTLLLIDLLLKKIEKGDDDDDDSLLHSTLKDMRKHMHKIGELIISANKKFWGWDEHDGVINILELINNARNNCCNYAKILKKVDTHDKGIDEIDQDEFTATAPPNIIGETDPDPDLSEVDMASKLYQEMQCGVDDFYLYVCCELPYYVETSEEHFSSETMKRLQGIAQEIKQKFLAFEDIYDAGVRRAFNEKLREVSVDVLCRQLKLDTEGHKSGNAGESFGIVMNVFYELVSSPNVDLMGWNDDGTKVLFPNIGTQSETLKKLAALFMRCNRDFTGYTQGKKWHQLGFTIVMQNNILTKRATMEHCFFNKHHPCKTKLIRHTPQRELDKRTFICAEDDCDKARAIKPAFNTSGGSSKPEHAFYQTCPAHIDQDPSIYTEGGVTEQQRIEANQLIEERKESGKKVKEEYLKRREALKKVSLHTMIYIVFI